MSVETFAQLKAGDEVAYQYGYIEWSWRIVTIVRRTTGGRIVTDDYTFEADGRTRGRVGANSPFECWFVTDEIRESVQQDKCLARLKRTNWKALAGRKLAAVVNLLEELESESE